MLSTTSPVTAPPKISVILAAGQPSSCRPTTDPGCKRPFKEPPLTAESGGATRAALLAMRAHRGTGSSNPLPSSGESVSHTDQAAAGREPRVSCGCAPLGRRRGRQRRAGRSNIAPKNSNFSVGPYSSTAVPPARFGDSDDTDPQQKRVASGRADVGWALSPDRAYVKPSRGALL